MRPEDMVEGPKPRVSIITVTYNYGHFLPEAIQSVLEQTFPDWELIVVDDGSTDNTADVVASFQDHRIRYVCQQNRGNPAARNAALKMATGEYVAFLDADDAWLPDKLQKQVTQLDSLPPSVGLVYSDAYVFNDEDGAVIRRFLQGRTPPRGRVFTQLLPEEGGWFIHDTASLIRRVVFERVGLYDESLRTYEDWEMWVRIANVYEVEGSDEPLARCRHHSSQLSGRLEEMYRYGVAAQRKVMASYPLSRKQRRTLRHNLAYQEYVYGSGLLQLGKRGEAWKAFVRSLRLRPGERKTYIHLGLPLLSPRLYNALYKSYSMVKRRLLAGGRT
jgi:glycosyltransferase involved in cell wall biosynthesis